LNASLDTGTNFHPLAMVEGQNGDRYLPERMIRLTWTFAPASPQGSSRIRVIGVPKLFQAIISLVSWLVLPSLICGIMTHANGQKSGKSAVAKYSSVVTDDRPGGIVIMSASMVILLIRPVGISGVDRAI
jgi:hypothetical protein